LHVNISPVSGQFEVVDEKAITVSGRISVLTGPMTSSDDVPTSVSDAGPFPLDSNDIYRESRLRGYHFGPAFRGVLSADRTGK